MTASGCKTDIAEGDANRPQERPFRSGDSRGRYASRLWDARAGGRACSLAGRFFTFQCKQLRAQVRTGERLDKGRWGKRRSQCTGGNGRTAGRKYPGKETADSGTSRRLQWVMLEGCGTGEPVETLRTIRSERIAERQSIHRGITRIIRGFQSTGQSAVIIHDCCNPREVVHE